MLVTILIFIAVLAVLVLSHEFGHFIVARRAGIKVEEFGFGFPPRLFGVHRITKPDGTKQWRVVWGSKNVHQELAQSEHVPGTVYSLNLIPLGGFVKIKGEDAVGEGANDPDSFVVKKVWQKASVLVAGVAMNVLVAIILLSVGFMVGMPQITDDADATRVTNAELQILEVLADKPAYQAGLLEGDVILKIDNLEKPTLKQFQDYVDAHKDSEVTLYISRGAERFEKKIHPIVYPDTGKGGVGIKAAQIGLVSYPWPTAIWKGIQNTWYALKEIVFAFGYLIKGLFTGADVADSVSGPVGVAKLTGQVARLGFSYLIQFTALLSLNLAVLNILPIPALDGGRLLFVIISGVRGKPVSPKAEQVAHFVGFALLMLLVIVITARDIGALIHA